MVLRPLRGEIDVSLAPGTDTVETTRRIRARLASFPGFVFGVSQFFSERLEETAGGEPAPISVIASGPDLDTLRALGAQVEAMMRSLCLRALVLASLPLALVGGVAAAFVFRITLSLGAVVGFVTLFGITARNAIMLVAHYRHLETVESMPFGPELVVRGATDRVLPILMTALVTELALVPLIAGGSRTGQEIEHPMAVIIAGGLASSTALTLLLLPSFHLRWGRPAGKAPGA